MTTDAVEQGRGTSDPRRGSAAGPGRSRRRFLGGVAAGAGVAGAFAAGRFVDQASGSTFAQDVRHFGARGDGHHDDAPPIQRAIDAASDNGGGVVLLPAGNYRLRSTLHVAHEIILQGVGWSIGGGSAGGDHRQPGSWLKVDDPSVGAVLLNGRAAGMRDLGIRHRQPKPSRATFTPVDYPFAIDVIADDCWIENVMLLNPTRGIHAHKPAGFIERLNLRRIYGQPLIVGIEIDNMVDVTMVDEVHFWPFWFDWTGIGPDAGLGAYALKNTTGIRSLRNDNPHFAQIFVFGAAVGMSFESGGTSGASGPTSKFHLSNADFDSCVTALQVTGANTTGQVVNLTAEGPNPNGGYVGVWVSPAAGGSGVQITNCHLRLYQANGIRVEEGRVSVHNAWVDSWNRSGSGFPAIEQVGNGVLVAGAGGWYDNGNGAPPANFVIA